MSTTVNSWKFRTLICFKEELYLGFVVSARFTAWPIFGVMATEGRSMVANIFQ